MFLILVLKQENVGTCNSSWSAWLRIKEPRWMPFLEFWIEIAKWPWKSRSMIAVFDTSLKNTKMYICYKFGDCSSSPLQVIVRTNWNSENSIANWQNDLEGQGQSFLFSIPAKCIPGCMFGANLVILVHICDELSCGQGNVYGLMDGRTDGRTQATTTSLWPQRPMW